MGFKCGIVGLPNVGKSTLFNALTQTAAAQAANYPFCTIEPNVGDVAVPDERLALLAAIAASKEIIPTRLTFVDIAGLVRGASRGEGLGNQFLANIRECDAIAHVVRCFEDDDITHVDGKIAPIADIETIETELMLADLESLEKRVVPIEKRAKGNDKEARELLDLMMRCLVLLREGKPARLVEVKVEERRTFAQLGLLSSKPVLYVCNVEEASADKGNAFSAEVEKRANAEGAVAVVVSARIESEIAVMPQEEQAEFLEAVGLSEPGAQPGDPRRLSPSRSHHLLHGGDRRRHGPGPCRKGPRVRRPRVSSTPISRKATFAPRRSLTRTMSPAREKRAPARLASSGSKERITSSPTATFFISGSRPEA